MNLSFATLIVVSTLLDPVGLKSAIHVLASDGCALKESFTSAPPVTVMSPSSKPDDLSLTVNFRIIRPSLEAAPSAIAFSGLKSFLKAVIVTEGESAVFAAATAVVESLLLASAFLVGVLPILSDSLSAATANAASVFLEASNS